jgi:hypothetical protein
MRRALALACAALAVAGCEEGGVVADGSSERTVAPSEGRWERTVAPANGLSGLEAVRVGDRVVVVGGADYEQTEVKALVLDLDSGRWSRAARSRLSWRAGHSVVAADGQVIVWGGGPGRGAAAYDVARDSWRRVPPGPLAGRYAHSAVWTSDEMIVWGGQVGREPRRDGAAYDPKTRRWRRIAAAPLSARSDHAAVWTGDQVDRLGRVAAGRRRPRPRALRRRGLRPANGHLAPPGTRPDPRRPLPSLGRRSRSRSQCGLDG